MKHSTLILFIILSLFWQGCSPFGKFSLVEINDSSIAINAETFQSYNFIKLVAEQRVKKIVASDVPAGRIWDFGIANKNVLLTCQAGDPNQDAAFSTSGNTLHVDVGPKPSDGQLVFNCTAQNTKFTFELHYLANRLGVVSSNLQQFNAQLETTETARYSADGNQVVIVSQGQVFLKDLSKKTVLLISSLDGTFKTQGNFISQNASISADGTKIAFSSNATNLITGTSGKQIFLKDLKTGTLSLVSSSDGTVANQGTGASDQADISPDGNYVVFQTNSANFGAAGQQIYVKNLLNQNLSVVSTGVNGLGNNTSSNAKIKSPFVVFTSTATNLITTATSGVQIFRKNIISGDMQLVSSIDGSSTAVGNAASDNASLSADGMKISFVSAATNLNANPTTKKQVYVKNMSSLTVFSASTVDGGLDTVGTEDSTNAMISNDGSKVVFTSKSINLVVGSTGQQIFLKDLSSKTTSLVSSIDGTVTQRGNFDSYNASFSLDGKHILFGSSASNFDNSNLGYLVFSKNLSNQKLSIISDLDSQAIIQGNSISYQPQLSADNKKVLFYSYASNIVNGIKVWTYNVFLKDLTTGKTVLVSERNGVPGNNQSFDARMTADGKKVVFASQATNLADGVSDNTIQIYLKDMETGAISIVSSQDGTSALRGNGSSYGPSISDDGNRIAFYSLATNLIADRTMTGYQVYLKEVTTNKIVHMSYSNADGVSPASQGFNQYFSAEISPDGKKIAFSATAGNLWPWTNFTQIYVRHIESGLYFFVSSTNGMANGQGGNNSYKPRFSGDSSKVVFHSFGGFHGCTVAYAQVFIKDITKADGALAPVSRIDDQSCYSNSRGNGHSYNATTNYDGSLVVFQSLATNLVAGTVLPAGPNRTHILMKNLNDLSRKIISSRDGTVNTQGNKDSYYPYISNDGTKIAFDSESDYFVSNIFGHQIYIYDNSSTASEPQP